MCNAVVKDGKIPEDWSMSWMVNVYKGKGDALACGSCDVERECMKLTMYDFNHIYFYSM